jgi:hypothetical protein
MKYSTSSLHAYLQNPCIDHSHWTWLDHGHGVCSAVHRPSPVVPPSIPSESDGTSYMQSKKKLSFASSEASKYVIGVITAFTRYSL